MFWSMFWSEINQVSKYGQNKRLCFRFHQTPMRQSGCVSENWPHMMPTQCSPTSEQWNLGPASIDLTVWNSISLLKTYTLECLEASFTSAWDIPSDGFEDALEGLQAPELRSSCIVWVEPGEASGQCTRTQNVVDGHRTLLEVNDATRHFLVRSMMLQASEPTTVTPCPSSWSTTPHASL